MLKQRGVRALLLVVVGSVWQSPIHASCYKFDVERAFRTSSAVFVGRVLTSTVVRRGPDAGDVETVATFDVTHRWKGADQKTLQVATCGGGDTVCTVGIDFVVGREYLVFAFGERLITTVCDTAELGDSSTALKWLRRQQRKKLANIRMQPTRLMRLAARG